MCLVGFEVFLGVFGFVWVCLGVFGWVRGVFRCAWVSLVVFRCVLVCLEWV